MNRFVCYIMFINKTQYSQLDVQVLIYKVVVWYVFVLPISIYRQRPCYVLSHKEYPKSSYTIIITRTRSRGNLTLHKTPDLLPSLQIPMGRLRNINGVPDWLAFIYVLWKLKSVAPAYARVPGISDANINHITNMIIQAWQHTGWILRTKHI